MGDSTDIDALIKEMNGTELSQEENSMVNSILNDLNDSGGGGSEKSPSPQITSQQQMPQITEEEKAMLIQQQMQQQKIAQQRMQQQMEQQRMQQIQQQQQMQQQQMQKQEAQKPKSMLDNIKDKINSNKDVFIVLILTIFFNLEIVSENMKLKNISVFYNQEKGKETIFSVLLKGVIISVLYLISKLIIK